MADWQRDTFLASMGLLAVAFLLVLSVVLVPSTAGVLAIISMLMVMLAGVLYAVDFLLIAYEIVTSKNDGGWKILWVALAWFFGPFGAAAYLFVARKERKV
jgi:hypothetical protein